MSFRQVLIATVSTIGLAVALAACGGPATSSGAGTGTSQSGGGALIHTTSMKVGSKTETVLKVEKGLTLYYFTPDSAGSVACTGGCATTWPPLISSSGALSSDPALQGSLTIVSGANGSQVAYKGHPLYTYSKDEDSGDAYGEGIGGKWFAATPDLAALAATPKPSSTYDPAY
jgi:predicted lipoprotein with Yx(FWY)xxD motif